MGMFGAIIAGAAQGTGQAMGEVADQQTKLQQQQNLLQMQADLETKKEAAVLQMKNAIANAPLNRAVGYMNDAQQQQVPIQAPPVTKLTGTDPGAPNDASGQQMTGLVGNTQDLLARVQALPDDNPDKAPMLAQIQRQQAADQQAAQESVAGQTRAPTPQELLANAQQKALASGDGEAYAALKQIGSDNYMTVPDGGAIFDKTKGEIVGNPGMSKFDRQMAVEDRRDARAEANNDAREDRLERALTAKKTDPAVLETNAQMLANYEMKPPSTRTQAYLEMRARAKEINPSYDEANYPAIQAMNTKFTSGQQGNSVRSIDAAVSHLALYREMAAAQKNGQMQLFNSIANRFAAETGSAVPTNLDAVASIVGPEVAKAIIPGGGGVAEREEYTKKFSLKNSPEQASGVADTYTALMGGQLQALARQYINVPGADPTHRLESFKGFLSPEAMPLLGTKPLVGGTGSGTDVVPNPMNPSNAGSGNGVLTYDPKTGTFH